MSRVAITSENSAAIGPYSHGIDTGHLVFLSGQTPIDQATGTLVDSDMNDFGEMNEVYASYFTEPFPARTTVAVAGLPLGAQVEIEMIAQRP